ncbi:MAG TPA: Holliday junction resolvase RuvX [Rhodanobacteraceae bacterium]|nr:Holliday junction resolvase RuvX [Rhodanobacteraceae bacterium]
MQDTPDTLAASSAASVLGFDFGTRLIGVAVGNRLSGSRALTTVSNRESQPDWQRIDALVAEWQPARLVVGLPLGMDGGEQAMSRAARAFASALEARYRLDVRLVDERLTSAEASRRFAGQRAAGTAKRKHAESIDAIAAEIILENWFASSNA